jgi:hypothetical protein
LREKNYVKSKFLTRHFDIGTENGNTLGKEVIYFHHLLDFIKKCVRFRAGYDLIGWHEFVSVEPSVIHDFLCKFEFESVVACIKVS